jgi:hypothetical protein
MLAARKQEENGCYDDNKLLEELDRTARHHYLMQNSRKESSHWVDGLLRNWHGKNDFLALAVSYSLYSFATHKLVADPSLVAHKKGQPYLMFAIEPNAPISLGVQIIALLFQHGADPNETLYSDKGSIWADLLWHALEKHGYWKTAMNQGEYEGVLEIFRLFISNGADLYALTSYQAQEQSLADENLVTGSETSISALDAIEIIFKSYTGDVFKRLGILTPKTYNKPRAKTILLRFWKSSR